MNSNEQNRIEYLHNVIDQLQADKYRLEQDIQHAEKDRKQTEADLAAEQHKNYRLRTDMDCLVKETKHYVSSVEKSAEDVKKSAETIAIKCVDQAELIDTLKDALSTANKKRKEAWDKNQSLLHEIEKLKCAYRNSQHEYVRKNVEKTKIAQTLIGMDDILAEKVKIIEMLSMDRRELIGDNRELKEELAEKMEVIKGLNHSNFELKRETFNQEHVIKRLQNAPKVAATPAETPEARDLRLAVMAFAASEMNKKAVIF